ARRRISGHDHASGSRDRRSDRAAHRAGRLTMITALRVSIYRDLLLAMRRPSDVLTAVAFFVIVVTLFPLGIGPDPALLRTIAPGVIWVAALLASMLALQRMFASDHSDGTLEQMLLGATPLGMIVAAKVFAHWLVSGLPLVLISPV